MNLWSPSLFKSRLVYGLSFVSFVSSLSAVAVPAPYRFPAEPAPEEIAKEIRESHPELDTSSEAAIAESSRRVSPQDFDQYKIVVDVFRGSDKLPVLGKYIRSFREAFRTEAGAPLTNAEAQQRFDAMANLEFAVVSLDGVPIKANLISGALEKEIDQVRRIGGNPQFEGVVDPVTGKVKPVPVTDKRMKTTPPGNYQLSPILRATKVLDEDGKSVTKSLPFPYYSSRTFDASTMFFGLHITGGYYIHATPHYDQLGKPASMGCIRQSSPDARELWDLVTNKAEGRKAMIRIHKMGSKAAYNRLREIVFDVSYRPEDKDILSSAGPGSPRDMVWLLTQLNENRRNLQNYLATIGPEYEGNGHGWLDPATGEFKPFDYPTCGGYDCVKTFNPDAIMKEQRAWVAQRWANGEKKAVEEAKARAAAAEGATEPSAEASEN